jgi:hypothetical protein
VLLTWQYDNISFWHYKCLRFVSTSYLFHVYLLGIFFPQLVATRSLKGLTKIPYNYTKHVKYGVPREFELPMINFEINLLPLLLIKLWKIAFCLSSHCFFWCKHNWMSSIEHYVHQSSRAFEKVPIQWLVAIMF